MVESRVVGAKGKLLRVLQPQEVSVEWGALECYVFSPLRAKWSASASNRFGGDLQEQEQDNSSSFKMWRTALLPSRLPPYVPRFRTSDDNDSYYVLPQFAVRYFKCFSFLRWRVGYDGAMQCMSCPIAVALPFVPREKRTTPLY